MSQKKRRITVERKIEFVINDHEKIEIPLPRELDKIEYDDTVDAIYCNSKNNVQIVMFEHDLIGIFLQAFKRFLEKIVSDEIDFESYQPITKNIGYFANQAYHDKNRSWSGYELLLQAWDYGKVQAWWYKKGNKIFLELTPFYYEWIRRSWGNPSFTPEISYGEFMKNYETLAITELNLETIKKWLNQIGYLLKLLKRNDIDDIYFRFEGKTLMKQKSTDFVINSQEKIQFILLKPAEKETCFEEIDVIYVNSAKNVSLMLCKSIHTYMALWGLQGRLEALLRGKLELHKSIEKDIGYLANQAEHDSSAAGLEFKLIAGTRYWVGNNYRFQWWGGHGVSTWLYQKNGKIILEITPDYNSGAQHSNYKEFMANYKPLVITELSPETARIWLAKAGHISKELDCANCC